MTDPARQSTALFAADSAGVPTVPAGYPGVRETASSAAIGGRSTNWRTLTDAQAVEAWGALRDWVEWFVNRYHLPLSTVPACWWQHDGLVEELSALHCAHRAAFDPTDNGNGPIGWHERLTLALPRLTRAYTGGCSNGHRNPPPLNRPPVDEEEWTAWITQSHAH